MRAILILLLAHCGLLLLASTDYTVLTGWFNESTFRCEFFRYNFANGWGHEYKSDYSLLVVATYLLAYLAGAIGYLLVWLRGLPVLAFLGTALSLVGVASFAIEGSHWLIAHNLSWMVFSPTLMFVLAAVTLVAARWQPLTEETVEEFAQNR